MILYLFIFATYFNKNVFPTEFTALLELKNDYENR